MIVKAIHFQVVLKKHSVAVLLRFGKIKSILTGLKEPQDVISVGKAQILNQLNYVHIFLYSVSYFVYPVPHSFLSVPMYIYKSIHILLIIWPISDPPFIYSFMRKNK